MHTRKLLFIFLFVSGFAHAQSGLTFNRRFVECEDTWVAFPKSKDSTYPFGFIYIDSQAGLTLNLEGSFTISASGTFSPQRIDNANMKVRLNPNRVQVAVIPPEKFKELGIQAVPDWLAVYKSDTGSVKRLYRWGFMYNGWNECAKALGYLERAYAMEPEYKGLKVELAFSYNCLKQYEKAVSVLRSAIESSPRDAYVHKELIYALIHSGNLEQAAEQCRKAISVCDDKSHHGENCYNLVYTFYSKKDKKNFDAWLPEAKNWNKDRAQLLAALGKMEEEMNR